MQKANCSKPSDPKYNIMQVLHIDNTKDEYKFVEYKIPKFIFHVLWRNEIWFIYTLFFAIAFKFLLPVAPIFAAHRKRSSELIFQAVWDSSKPCLWESNNKISVINTLNIIQIKFAMWTFFLGQSCL